MTYNAKTTFSNGLQTYLDTFYVIMMHLEFQVTDCVLFVDIFVKKNSEIHYLCLLQKRLLFVD